MRISGRFLFSCIAALALASACKSRNSNSNLRSDETPALPDLPTIRDLETTIEIKEFTGEGAGFCAAEEIEKGLFGSQDTNHAWHVFFIKTGDAKCAAKFPKTMRLTQKFLKAKLKQVKKDDKVSEVCSVEVLYQCIDGIDAPAGAGAAAQSTAPAQTPSPTSSDQ